MTVLNTDFFVFADETTAENVLPDTSVILCGVRLGLLMVARALFVFSTDLCFRFPVDGVWAMGATLCGDPLRSSSLDVWIMGLVRNWLWRMLLSMAPVTVTTDTLRRRVTMPWMTERAVGVCSWPGVKLIVLQNLQGFLVFTVCSCVRPCMVVRGWTRVVRTEVQGVMIQLLLACPSVRAGMLKVQHRQPTLWLWVPNVSLDRFYGRPRVCF